MILSVLFQQGKQQKRKHSNILKSIKDGDFVMEEMDMREEYDIKALNPRKNPYAKKDQEVCYDEYERYND